MCCLGIVSDNFRPKSSKSHENAITLSGARPIFCRSKVRRVGDKFQGPKDRAPAERVDCLNVTVWEKCVSHDNLYEVSRKIRTENKKRENPVEPYERVSPTDRTDISEEILECGSKGLEKKRNWKEPGSVGESSGTNTDELIRPPKKPVAEESLQSLVSRSEPHKQVFEEWQRSYHVPPDISAEDFRGILGNITASNSLTFTDKEIPPEGKDHTKALYVEVRCGRHSLNNVLVDNGSGVNIMPKSTFEKLYCDEEPIEANSIDVQGFDGSKKKSLGEIELPIFIESFSFKVKFQVMEVNSSYSCLLGRPWIHSVEAVPSSLHQSLKFMVDGKPKVIHGFPERSVISNINTASLFNL